MKCGCWGGSGMPNLRTQHMIAKRCKSIRARNKESFFLQWATLLRPQGRVNDKGVTLFFLLWEEGVGVHTHKITASKLTSCINKGSFSSCTSVKSPTFTSMASCPSQNNVWHVSLHKPGTSFGTSMQFCKNHRTVVNHTVKRGIAYV